MIIGISGMIASGKSTLAKGLNNFYQNSVLLEEFKEDDSVFNTFLDWFYRKKENIDIAFQTYIIESSSNLLKKSIFEFKKNHDLKNNHIFLDRFNLEHYIFAILTLKSKPIKYLKAFDAMFYKLIDIENNPNLVIFLDINFEIFKERLFKRARQSEINNYQKNETYFKELHELYKDLFIKLMTSFSIPYIIIDANYKTDNQILVEAIQKIENFNFNQ